MKCWSNTNISQKSYFGTFLSKIIIIFSKAFLCFRYRSSFLLITLFFSYSLLSKHYPVIIVCNKLSYKLPILKLFIYF